MTTTSFLQMVTLVLSLFMSSIFKFLLGVFFITMNTRNMLYFKKCLSNIFLSFLYLWEHCFFGNMLYKEVRCRGSSPFFILDVHCRWVVLLIVWGWALGAVTCHVVQEQWRERAPSSFLGTGLILGNILKLVNFIFGIPQIPFCTTPFPYKGALPSGDTPPSVALLPNLPLPHCSKVTCLLSLLLSYNFSLLSTRWTTVC